MVLGLLQAVQVEEVPVPARE
jgi:hypothetical protein